MAINWSDTPYEDAVAEQATSQTDLRALAVLLAQDATELKEAIYDRKGIDPLTNREELAISNLNKHISALHSAARKAGIP